MKNIFSNVVSDTNSLSLLQDTNFDEITTNVNAYFDIDNVSYLIEKQGSSVKITISPNYILQVFTYYLGENPLSDDFLSSNIFVLDNLDTRVYKLAIKNEKGIIIIFDEINVSIL